MLTPEQLDKLPDNLVRLYAQLEEDIIVNMAERINALNLFIPAADWQFQKVKEMGNSYNMILEKLSGSTGKTEEILSDMMTAAASESMKHEDEIHKSAGKEVPPLAQSAALLATLNAGMRKTAGYFENLCRTTANNGSKQFVDALDRAYMQVISGAFSKDEAIKSAVKDLAKQGITAAVYKNGRRMSLESAVRMNVITGINQTCAELQLQRADEVGCDLVAVSAHAGARPSHALWQGEVYSRSGKHKHYPDFESSTGYGTVTGLCGANCRHTFYPFYEGISVNAYTKKELDEMNRKSVNYNGQKLTEYEASQIQRKIERNIRRWKREKEASKVIGIGEDEAAAKLKYWRLEMNSFISQTGFKRQYAREDIFSKKPAKTAKNIKAVSEVAKTEKSIGKSIGYAGVFRKAESIDDAKEYAIDMLYLEYAEYDKISLDAANMLNYEIARVYDVFGNLHEAGYLRDIRYYPKKAEWEAMYTKTWNGIYMRNLSSKNFMKKLKKNAEEQREMGFWSTDAAEHGIRHELGHAVYHYLLNNNADKNDKITALRESIMKKHGITKWDMNNDSRENIKQAGDSISYYALKDNSEFIAEAVAEYMTGNPREISQKAIDVLLEE